MVYISFCIINFEPDFITYFYFINRFPSYVDCNVSRNHSSLRFSIRDTVTLLLEISFFTKINFCYKQHEMNIHSIIALVVCTQNTYYMMLHDKQTFLISLLYTLLWNTFVVCFYLQTSILLIYVNEMSLTIFARKNQLSFEVTFFRLAIFVLAYSFNSFDI